MDCNRDESLRCIEKAKELILNNETERAIKFLTTAQSLFPSTEARKLLLESMRRFSSRSGHNHQKNTANGTQSDPQKDFNKKSDQKSHSNSLGRKERTNSSSGQRYNRGLSGIGSHRDYSEEQMTAVKQIKKCKDYYEILGVTKESIDSQIKKQYRKLILQFHPDKNKAPGASEAFQMIRNAFAVLSDPELRDNYDKYGSEVNQPQRYQTYSRTFEADISSGQIFDMFFGDGFSSNRFNVRRNNRSHATYRSQDVDSGHTSLLHMLPILILLCLSIINTVFVSDLTYSLIRTHKYHSERHTNNLEVPYFVTENFEKDNKGSIGPIEEQVEKDYITYLRTSCFKERSYKESMIWKARRFNDRDLEEIANALKTPSCDHLYKIFQQ